MDLNNMEQQMMQVCESEQINVKTIIDKIYMKKTAALNLWVI